MFFAHPIAPEPDRPLRTWQGVCVPKVLDAIERKVSGIVVAVTGSGKSVAIAEVLALFLLQAGNAATVVVTTSSRRLVEQLAGTFGERIGHARVGRYYTSAKEADRQVVVCCNNSAMALAAILRRQGRAVDLWIADEAHRTEAEGLTVAAHALQPAAKVGFTATPFRSDDSESLQLFGELIYRYGFGEALRDGVVVPWRVVPWTRECTPVDDAILTMIRDYTTGPGVVNATSIRDAEDYAALLEEQGIPAAAVHSELDQATQDARLNALREGELRCVVYPSLLSEGADFPWLRWIGLRRDVQARVRFIQEVGRVLRTWPGKAEAIILDPIGLFNRFSLAYDEEIGEKKPEEVTPAGEREGGGGGLPGPAPMARPADVVATWSRQLFLAAELDGLLEGTKRAFILDHSGPATEKQLSAVGKMAWAGRWMPPEHAAVVKRLAASGDLPNRGCASDLLDVLFAVGRQKHPWRPSLPVVAPSDELLDRVRADIEEGGWFAAGAVRAGVRAVAVVRGARLVVATSKTDEAEVIPTAVHVAAARLAARHAGAGATVHVSDEWGFKVLTGAASARHPAVQAALRSAAPAVTYALVEQRENPAAGMAWREVQRHRSAS